MVDVDPKAPDPFQERALEGIESLSKYQNVIWAGLLLIGLAILAVIYYNHHSSRQEEAAWSGIDDLSTTEKFEAGLPSRRGTSAEGYYLLQYARHLKEKGDRDSLLKARSLYTRVTEIEDGVYKKVAEDNLKALGKTLEFLETLPAPPEEEETAEEDSSGEAEETEEAPSEESEETTEEPPAEETPEDDSSGDASEED